MPEFSHTPDDVAQTEAAIGNEATEVNSSTWLHLDQSEARVVQFALDSAKGQIAARPEMPEPENREVVAKRLNSIDQLLTVLTTADPGEVPGVTMDTEERTAIELALQALDGRYEHSISKEEYSENRELLVAQRVVIKNLLERMGAV